MFDPFKKLKLAGAFLGVVADEAAAGTAESLDISELFGRLSLKDLRGMRLPADRLLEQPGVRALFESRYMPEPEPLDRLTALGEGTLGFEYARYMRQNKLAPPTPSRRIDFNDPAAYLAERVRMTHPLLHLITEYDASSLGELALQAYYIGQTGNLISGVIISSALLQITRDTPDQLGPALEVTSEAFQRGKIARSFLGIAWEELWSAQVPQLRELVEIPSRSSTVALLRFAAAPAPEPRASRSGTFSGFSGSEDGFAALGRANSPSPSSTASSSSNASSNTNAPPPRPRNFTGFGGAPLKPDPDPPTPRKPASTPARPEPARREPAAPEQRPRQSSSSSSLLASFMALSEQAAHPEPPPAAAPPPVKPPVVQTPPVQPPTQPRFQPPPVQPPAQQPPPQQPPPRVEARPVKPPPPAPPAKPGEPGYKIEEQAKNITPALSPDDPDYF
jgi:ubiquinone biosynthesis protein Coq4